VLVILLGGILETSKDTLINLLTKGLSRTAVILAKFSGAVLLWSVSLAVAFFVTWVYTIYLLPEGGVENLFLSVFCLWVYGVFLLAVLVLAATLAKGNYACLLLLGFTVVITMILNIFPPLVAYNPLSLATQSLGVLTNATELSVMYSALWVSAVLSVVLIALAVLVFRKKQI